jgi:hypothetical protein
VISAGTTYTFGPTLRAYAGDILYINLTNTLIRYRSLLVTSIARTIKIWNGSASGALLIERATLGLKWVLDVTGRRENAS